ncbi:MAG: hypothetical protein FWF70_03905 [Bacteroidetes bacterium]|nr:hypothetical protein [Bacteroidota bacterium]MCL1968478.1 hypothetical protein [Bacteroidota bacterium]
MKKRNLKLFTAIIAVALVAGGIIFYACKKDILLDNVTGNNTEKPLKSMIRLSPELENLFNQLQIPNFGNIRLVGEEILKFESAAHYNQVYESLNALYDAWTDLFIQTYDTGDEAALDATIERLNFDDNIPLLWFADRYKIAHPLVRDIVEAESSWLAQGGRNLPPEDEITPCMIEQTLLSRYHEFCIGDTICQLRPESYQILIPTSEIRYINQIRAKSIQELLMLSREPGPGGPPWKDKIVIITPKSGTCYESYWDNGDYEDHNTGSTKYVFSHRYFFRYTWINENVKITVTMKNYKWKNNDMKKDYSSPCALGFYTDLYYEGTTCYQSNSILVTKGTPHKAFSKSRSMLPIVFMLDPKNFRDNVNLSYNVVTEERIIVGGQMVVVDTDNIL